MLRSLPIALGLFVALAVAPRCAFADPPTAVRIAVVDPTHAVDCVQADELRRDVSAHLGRDPFDANALRSIEVVLGHDSGFTARVFAREEPSGVPAVRVLDDSRCPRLREALVLAVALAIDPDAPLALAPPAVPASSSPPRASASPAPSTPSRPIERASWDSDDRLLLRGGVIVGVAPVPAPFVATGFATGRHGIVRGHLDVLRSFETRTADGAFGFSFTALAASVCVGSAWSRIALDACGGLRVGIVTGVVHRLEGLTPREPGDYPWFGAHLAAIASIRVINPLVIELGAEPFVALYRHVFAVRRGDATEVVYEQSPFGALLYGGVRIRFR